MAGDTAEDLYDLVLRLPVGERLRLVERIAHDLSTTARPAPAPFDWAMLAGAAPGLLAGEDAQAWVRQSREESDAREQSFGQQS